MYQLVAIWIVLVVSFCACFWLLLDSISSKAKYYLAGYQAAYERIESLEGELRVSRKSAGVAARLQADELHDAKQKNAELAKRLADALRDAKYWESVADRLRRRIEVAHKSLQGDSCTTEDADGKEEE